MVYVLDADNRTAIISRIRKAFDGLPGIAKLSGRAS